MTGDDASQPDRIMATTRLQHCRPTTSPGRPRSKELDNAIIGAATTLLRQQRYAAVTMESIASKAGVGKASLYRRWPNKSALVVDVLLRLSLKMQLKLSELSYRDHLILGMQGLREMLSGTYAEAIVSIIAEMQSDEKLRARFYNSFISTIQALAGADLQLAIERGEVRSDIQKDLVFDQLFGTFYYRLLVIHEPIDDAYIEQIVDNVMRQLS